jgi:hypothetical protein
VNEPNQTDRREPQRRRKQLKRKIGTSDCFPPLFALPLAMALLDTVIRTEKEMSRPMRHSTQLLGNEILTAHANEAGKSAVMWQASKPVHFSSVQLILFLLIDADLG